VILRGHMRGSGFRALGPPRLSEKLAILAGCLAKSRGKDAYKQAKRSGRKYI